MLTDGQKHPGAPSKQTFQQPKERGQRPTQVGLLEGVAMWGVNDLGARDLRHDADIHSSIRAVYVDNVRRPLAVGTNHAPEGT